MHLGNGLGSMLSFRFKEYCWMKKLLKISAFFWKLAANIPLSSNGGTFVVSFWLIILLRVVQYVLRPKAGLESFLQRVEKISKHSNAFPFNGFMTSFCKFIINPMLSLNRTFNRRGYQWRIFIVTYHFVGDKTRRYATLRWRGL